MFPPNPHGAPDWRDAQVEERTVEYLFELPRPMRRLVMLMFVAIELGAPALFAGLGRFSRLRPERRLAALQRWKTSRLPLFRLLAEALKAQLSMMYLSHVDVQRHIRAWKSCDRPGDVLALPVRTDVFDATTPNGLREGV